MNSASYDAVVVGSGFGGATTALCLVEAGLKVVLLERGDWARRDDLDWDPESVLLRKRYQGASPVLTRQYDDTTFEPVYPNEVVGGASVFYGGASLRLRESDFESWPIGYEDLEPYYTRAERLLEVHGEAGSDPFEPPRSGDYPFRPIGLSEPARRIHDAAIEMGCRPFRIPLAINFENGARTTCVKCITCDGFPCKIQAKNDVAATVLRRAQDAGLEIVPNTIVRNVGVTKGSASSVACVDGGTGRSTSISAAVVVISSGAIQSPAILLRSDLADSPQQRLIGRYLMRHCNAVVSAGFPFRTNPEQVFHKQICIADFYEDVRERCGLAAGMVQDIYTPSRAVLHHFAPRGLKSVAGLASGYLQNLLCIAEDEPQYENAVGLSAQTDRYGMEIPTVMHRYTPADCERRDYLVGKASRILRRAGAILSYSYKLDTFSHAVGTVRFGDDPDESVLDPHCRFWGIDNLYVVDGSFMPSSGGVNPSLTIAANALRVADHIRNETSRG